MLENTSVPMCLKEWFEIWPYCFSTYYCKVNLPLSSVWDYTRVNEQPATVLTVSYRCVYSYHKHCVPMCLLSYFGCAVNFFLTMVCLGSKKVVKHWCTIYSDTNITIYITNTSSTLWVCLFWFLSCIYSANFCCSLITTTTTHYYFLQRSYLTVCY